VCPQCGSAAAVHSIEEVAALARSQLGQLGGQGQGPTAPPEQGYAAQPQAGPVPGYAQQPQAGPVPGYAQQPQAGPVPGRRQRGGFRMPGSSGGDFSFGDDLTDVAMTAATQFIGRAIGRRLQRTFEQQVMPTLAAKQEAIMRDQIAIAQRHPDLRACLTDKVVFLAGGSRVVPMSGTSGMLTLEQADALVAQLRDG
jgi:hypothetical protein